MTNNDNDYIFFLFRLYFGGHVFYKQRLQRDFYHRRRQISFPILCGLKNLIVDDNKKWTY